MLGRHGGLHCTAAHSDRSDCTAGARAICYSIGVEFRILVEREKPTITIINKKNIITNKKNDHKR